VSAHAEQGDEPVYTPTSGTVSGWVGLAIAVIVLAAVLVDDRTLHGLRYGLAALVFGVLVWSFLLRPRVVVGSREVELRNPFSSWHVPLAGVRVVEVRAVTRVSTEDRTYEGVAVGRPARSLLRGGQQRTRFLETPGRSIRLPNEPEATRRQRGQLDANAVADLLVEQILHGADRARESGQQPAPVRRTWAVLEPGALVVLVAALVVSLLA
jgi:hypothetical protein